jgi:hypothetical protein
MNKKQFNLRQHRVAFYDDGKGLMEKHTKFMQECQCAKAKAGKTPHEQKMECLEEFNSGKKGQPDSWAKGKAAK